ncbi:MAG: hypothetical protein A2016_04660 [Elusimicrobia bacterium GWF2_62_30]|nr:MAG: hypothetical protein A2016_04660 [Elusimicrobia bacterium GWF2_62_30]
MYMKNIVFAAIISCALPAAAAAADLATYSFGSGANCHGVWKLPDSSTGTISFTGTFGEDADYNPAATHPSYTVMYISGSSVTVDNVTGLMWLTDPTLEGLTTYTWENALAACAVSINMVNVAGYNNWRLPTVREMATIVDYGKNVSDAVNTAAFYNTGGANVWTSTTYAGDPTTAWLVALYDGYVGKAAKTLSYRVRCVRGP